MATAASTRCEIQPLESRRLLSLVFGYDDALVAAAAKNGGGPSGPAIRLDLVALHEFGHSLGLAHSEDTGSIMYPYYNANYDLSGFAADSAVATLRSLYDDFENGWTDAGDGLADHVVTLTYSFVRDGAKMDQGGSSNTFAAFGKRFGAGQWEPIFTGELARWAGVSNGRLAFQAFDSDGVENAVYAFNIAGATQHDTRFGDIRIAGHKFDGAGKVLAHTYYPPPNGSTAAGDAHFDTAENWVLAGGGSLTATGNGSTTGGALAVGRHAGPSPFAAGPLLGGGNLLGSLHSDPLAGTSAEDWLA